MSVFIRSLLNRSQTIDSVALAAFALQERGNVTAAIQAAADAKSINLWAGPVDTPTTESFLEYIPVTTDVITLPGYAENVSIAPAGTIAALTINMPATPRDKQRVNLMFDQIVTALTLQITAGSGHTLRGALTAATAKGFGTWMYRAQGKIWYRVG
jgi:hypothetical protein